MHLNEHTKSGTGEPHCELDAEAEIEITPAMIEVGADVLGERLLGRRML
jgi:hypothetical protein